MTREKFKKELKAALRALSRDPSLGYLAITAKPETQIRDKVACWFHRKYQYPKLVTAREYQINSKHTRGQKKRVDLTLLNAALTPVAAMEFKAMIVPDPLANSNHHLMIDLQNDLAKLGRITHFPRFGIMLMVHIENVERLRQQGLNGRVVKYMPKFLRCASDKGHDAPKKAIDNASGFFERANLDVTRLIIKLGRVWGARVKLACFILEPKQMS